MSSTSGYKSWVKAQDVDGGELLSITGGSDAWAQEQEQERALVKTVPSHCPVTGGHQRRPSTQGALTPLELYNFDFDVHQYSQYLEKAPSPCRKHFLTLTIAHFKNLFFVKTLLRSWIKTWTLHLKRSSLTGGEEKRKRGDRKRGAKERQWLALWQWPAVPG